MNARITERPKRTNLQNRSLHLWLRQVSEVLNDAGFDVKKVLSNRNNQKVINYIEQAVKMLKGIEGVGAFANVISGAVCTLNKCIALLESAGEVDIPWDKDGRMAKELLWKPVMEAMTGEESTTQMDTADPSEVCKVITRHIGEKFGVVLPPWPDRWGLMAARSKSHTTEE